jgi:hypothetical protein
MTCGILEGVMKIAYARESRVRGFFKTYVGSISVQSIGLYAEQRE